MVASRRTTTRYSNSYDTNTSSNVCDTFSKFIATVSNFSGTYSKVIDTSIFIGTNTVSNFSGILGICIGTNSNGFDTFNSFFGTFSTFIGTITYSIGT